MKLLDELRTKVAQENQTAVAAEIGITQAMLCMILNGKRRAGPETLAKIIRAYPHLAETCADYWAGRLREER